MKKFLLEFLLNHYLTTFKLEIMFFRKVNFKVLVLAVFAVITFVQCTEDDGTINPEASGKANFKMTDAPIDDANVSGAFVTVTEIKVDGQTFAGFSGKQTIDLLAYQNGNVKALGLGDIEAGTYTNISLVLDYDVDANGNSPGCYILTTDNVKHEVQASSSAQQELVLASNFVVEENQTTDVVIDFDVRKAVKAEAQAASDNKYEFVSKGELESSLRVVVEAETGDVQGKCQNDNGSDRVVVYAYKKGTWNKSAETQGQGSSNIEFKNASSSAVVDANGNYTLSFLEEGDYEVHYASYKQESNGSATFEGMLNLGLIGIISFNDITVEAGIDLTLNATVSALIP